MSEFMTGAEMVVRALRDQGVEHVFGYPGGAVLPIYDALFHEPELTHVLVRHEQARSMRPRAMPARPAKSAACSSPPGRAPPMPSRA
jgi:glyoxylate carboligase